MSFQDIRDTRKRRRKKEEIQVYHSKFSEFSKPGRSEINYLSLWTKDLKEKKVLIVNSAFS